MRYLTLEDEDGTVLSKRQELCNDTEDLKPQLFLYVVSNCVRTVNVEYWWRVGSPAFPTINLTWTVLGSNPSLVSERVTIGL